MKRREIGIERRSCIKVGIVFLYSISAFILLSPCPSEAGAMDQSYSCTVCHSDKKKDFARDIHFERGMMCEQCHGGDASVMDNRAHDRSAGFKSSMNDAKPPFSKKQIVHLCSSCHSDARKMLQYALPANQEELYRISQHGIALYKKNDENIAVCTDCHGTHNILPPRDPRSSVYVKNLPFTCASCHSREDLMKAYGLPWDTFEKFKDSVHGRALLEENDLRSPNCATCHGVHGASPPEVKEIENVCGQCHNKTRQFFNLGPHCPAKEEKGMEECVSCHENHGISKSSLELFDVVCIKCHDPGSGAYRRGQKIKALIFEAAGAIEDARTEAGKALQSGISIERYKQDLDEAETSLIRAAPETHSLSIEAIEKLAKESMTIADDVKLELFHHHEELQERKLILIVVWGFILLIVPVTVAKRYRINKRLQDTQ